MPTDLDKAFSPRNLMLAWRWTLSSPRSEYKNYFREVYGAYSVVVEPCLKVLKQKLDSGAFQPKPPCKLYIPKASGILRPISLLSVEDQIVYQALANIIAEKHHKVARKRYLKQTFGHLYAGRGSAFFYRKWQDGYHSFSDAARDAYLAGYRTAASFDLTACYDTIDHNVLGQLLERIGLDEDFRDWLALFLQAWTQDTDLGLDAIYHGHGIPQGPLPSGLLAEVVLSRFDEAMAGRRSLVYLRYVDDIRMYARDEHALRHALVELDLVSKSIGLFPQSNKISIHKVKRIEDEIKGVSRPPEPHAVRVAKDQVQVRRRLKELTKGYKIGNETRFKWVLGLARPTKELSRRLLRVLVAYPHLYPSVFRHLRQWKIIPDDIARCMLAMLKDQDLYPTFSAALIDCVMGRAPVSLENDYLTEISRLAKTAVSAPLGYSDLRCNAVAWALNYNKLSFDECLATMGSCNWWCKTQILRHVNFALLGKPSTRHMLTLLAADQSPDVSILAAYRLASLGLGLDAAVSGQRIPEADEVLKSFGVIRRASTRVCGISTGLRVMFGSDPFHPRSWRAVLGRHYDAARQSVVEAAGKLRANSSEWANLMDSFVDVFLDALFAHDARLGSYTVGKPGSVLNGSGRLFTHYPVAAHVFKDIHDLRLQSHLSHPYVKSTGRRTRRIRYKEVQRLASRLKSGLEEVAKLW